MRVPWRGWRAGFGGALVAGLLLAMPPADEAELLEALGLADRRIEAGRWADAVEALTAHLDTQAPSDALRAWAPWFLARLERCVFELQTEPATVAELVGPAFVDHDPRRGHLTLRYDGMSPQHPVPEGESAEELIKNYVRWRNRQRTRPLSGIFPTDFGWGAWGMVPPVAFRDELNLTLVYDPTQTDHRFETGPALRLGLDGSDDHHLQLEIRTGSSGARRVLHSLALYQGRNGTRELLKRKPLSEDEPSPIELKVEVTPSQVNISINGGLVLRTANKTRRVGGFAISAASHLTRVDIEGETDGRWIERLREDRRSRDRRDFDLFRDAPERIPVWLEPRPLDDREHGRLTPRAYPGPRTAALDEAADRIDDLLRDDDLARAWEVLEPFDHGETFLFHAWCRAVILASAGWTAAAVDEARLVMTGVQFPDEPTDDMPLAIRVLAARLVAPTAEVSHAALEGLAREHPTAAGPWEQLADAYLIDGQPQRSAETVRRALRAGAPRSALAAVVDLLIRAERGPEWTGAFEQKTRHFVIHSDISARFCREAGQQLESVWAGYRRILGSVAPDEDRARLPIYIFSTQGAYLSHAKDLFSAEPTRTAGLFSRQLQQVLVWDQPDRAATMRTLRHEAFHAYLDALVGDAPPWLHEGLAEYFENADSRNGRMTPGDPVVEYVLGLDGAPAVSYAKLTTMAPHDFYALPELTYPHAWRLAHFLLHEGTGERRVIDTLITELATGAAQDSAVATAFEAFTAGELDAGVDAHTQSLRAALEPDGP